MKEMTCVTVAKIDKFSNEKSRTKGMRKLIDSLEQYNRRFF